MRVIFQPVIPLNNHTDILAYVEPLIPTSLVSCGQGATEGARHEDSGLVRVKRLYSPDLSRFGMIVRLTDIWRLVDVVPVFGEECDTEWTSDTAIDEAQSFWVNVYNNKEAFQSLAT